MTHIVWSFTEFPRDFQKDVLKPFSEILKKGESIQLVGAPGAGASTIIRLITQVSKVKDIYFPPKLNIQFLVFDADTLLEKSSLTASRIFLSLFGPQEAIPEDNVEINKRLTENIERICSEGRIVLIIDHIQQLNFTEFQPFFANLMNIYRKFRPNVCFVFTSQKKLTRPEDLINFGDFGRILVSNIINLPQLNRNDSFWFMNDMEKKINVSLKEKEKEKIFEVSLGFPRTMKKLVEAVSRGNYIDELKINPRLDLPLSLHLEELIEYSGLINIPLLEIYKNNKELQMGEKISDVLLPKKLTKIEEKLLKFLIKEKEKIIDRDRGIEVIWGENAQGISDHAYDQIIHRLRSKLINSVPKVEIETVRGRGHVLKTEN